MGLTVVVKNRSAVVDHEGNRPVNGHAVVGVHVLSAAAVCTVLGRRERQRVGSHRDIRYIEYVGRTRVEVNKALLDAVHVVLTAGRRDRDLGRRGRYRATEARDHRVEIVQLR